MIEILTQNLSDSLSRGGFFTASNYNNTVMEGKKHMVSSARDRHFFFGQKCDEDSNNYYITVVWSSNVALRVISLLFD